MHSFIRPTPLWCYTTWNGWMRHSGCVCGATWLHAKFWGKHATNNKTILKSRRYTWRPCVSTSYPLIHISPWWSRLKQQTRCHPPHCLNVVSAIAAMACRLKSLRCSCPICSHIRPTVKWTAAFNLWNSNQVNQMNGINIRYTVLLMCMNDTGAHPAVLG